MIFTNFNNMPIKFNFNKIAFFHFFAFFKGEKFDEINKFYELLSTAVAEEKQTQKSSRKAHYTIKDGILEFKNLTNVALVKDEKNKMPYSNKEFVEAEKIKKQKLDEFLESEKGEKLKIKSQPCRTNQIPIFRKESVFVILVSGRYEFVYFTMSNGSFTNS